MTNSIPAGDPVAKLAEAIRFDATSRMSGFASVEGLSRCRYTLLRPILPLSQRHQSPADDVRLDFPGPFENVQDARVAKDSADFIFQRISVAAVDL